MLGKPNNFFVANGLSELRFANPTDVSPFSNASGEEEYSDLSFSELAGRKRRRPLLKRRSSSKKSGQGIVAKSIDNMQRNRAERRKLVGGLLEKATSPEATERRQKRRSEKTSLKDRTLRVQEAAAAQLGKTSPEEAALLQQLSKPSAPEAPAGMSKGLKIGLIVTGVVAVAAIAFVVYRKMKK